MKNSNEHLEKIRAACIRANPDIVELKRFVKRGKKYPGLQREIRLADVLLAIEEKLLGKHKAMSFATATPLLEICNCWNKKDDDLSHQSPETLEFIASLL